MFLLVGKPDLSLLTCINKGFFINKTSIPATSCLRFKIQTSRKTEHGVKSGEYFLGCEILYEALRLFPGFTIGKGWRGAWVRNYNRKRFEPGWLPGEIQSAGP